MLQPGASLRPVITKMSCTPPSATPLLFLNRASRTGPFGAVNHGTAFFAPSSVATAIKGFCAGLEPPMFGCEWHEKHWFELKRGPSPLFEPPCTTSISPNLDCPSWKNAVSSAVRPGSGPPALAGPPRTPGSRGVDLVWLKAQAHVSKIIARIRWNLLSTLLFSVIRYDLVEPSKIRARDGGVSSGS